MRHEKQIDLKISCEWLQLGGRTEKGKIHEEKSLQAGFQNWQIFHNGSTWRSQLIVIFSTSPKLETQEMSSKSQWLPKHEKLNSPKLPELSLKIKQLPQWPNEMCSNIDILSPGLNEVSLDIAKVLSPKVQQLSPTINKLYGKKRPNVLAEVFIFPTVPEESVEVEAPQVTRREITSKPRRFQFEIERCMHKNIEDQHRPRFVSEPCINKYSKLIASRGIKLTEAAY